MKEIIIKGVNCKDAKATIMTQHTHQPFLRKPKALPHGLETLEFDKFADIFGSNSLNLNLRNGRGEKDQQSYLQLLHAT